MRSFFLMTIIGLFLDPAIGMSKPVGKASFTATTSGGFDVKGEGAAVESADQTIFIVKLADFKTGMDLRDKHFCDTLECGKFPEAKLVLPGKIDKTATAFSGQLTLHGVTKPFSGTVSGSTAKGKLKLSDFGVKAPDYKLIHVNEEVEIAVEVTL